MDVGGRALAGVSAKHLPTPAEGKINHRIKVVRQPHHERFF